MLIIEVIGTDKHQPSLEQVKDLWRSLGLDFSVYEHGGVISVNKIVAPPELRGQGLGTKAIRALVDYADQTGQRVALTPSGDFGGNKARLIKFYQRFDFRRNKGRYRDFLTRETMIRYPKSAAVKENFADGRNPGRKGLAKRSGVNCKQSVTALRKIAKNSSGERQRMAHWCANMKSGKKHKK